jgi:hypothetical protein
MHRFAVCCITLSAKPVISSAKLFLCLLGVDLSLSCCSFWLKKNSARQHSIAFDDRMKAVKMDGNHCCQVANGW